MTAARAAIALVRSGFVKVAGDRYDVLQVVGLFTVAYGVGLIYRPAGIIAAGLVVFALGVLGDLAKGATR